MAIGIKTLVQDISYGEVTQADQELTDHLAERWTVAHIQVFAVREDAEYGDMDQFTRTTTAIYRVVTLQRTVAQPEPETKVAAEAQPGPVWTPEEEAYLYDLNTVNMMNRVYLEDGDEEDSNG